ncbi:MAG TPA: hypothetical protein VG225_07365 [Terracidiphilus sp.]|jgi:4-amino-4-deoxy-L-arabinose transferase-like glycosyltransferase|nr:hypothetical protein [Terracidiphilus sp.]
MRVAPVAKDPAVHSFLTLRSAVGWVALCLPFLLVIPWWAISNHLLPSSMSSYYYTGMRNVFVGSLCAIGIINMCCRGYDRRDTIAGILSGLFALGVGFFPTTPDSGATPFQEIVGNIHLTCAALLFLTLAYFCLFLFTMSASDRAVTRRKRHRNRVYRICGWVIIASVVLIAIFRTLHRPYLIGPLGSMFCFETTALLAFGTAWLAKGGTILKDEMQQERAELEQERRRQQRQMAGA